MEKCVGLLLLTGEYIDRYFPKSHGGDNRQTRNSGKYRDLGRAAAYRGARAGLGTD